MVNTLSHRANLLLASSTYEIDLENQILSAGISNKEYQVLEEKTTKNKQNQIKTDFTLNQQGLLLHKNKLYIPNVT